MNGIYAHVLIWIVSGTSFSEHNEQYSSVDGIWLHLHFFICPIQSSQTNAHFLFVTFGCSYSVHIL